MARRYGEVKHSSKKAKRWIFRTHSGGAYEHSVIFQGAKKASIHLEVVRTYEKGPAFKARACMLAHARWMQQYRRAAGGPSQIGYKRKHDRCVVAQGATPTRAVKRATIKLMKAIK